MRSWFLGSALLCSAGAEGGVKLAPHLNASVSPSHHRKTREALLRTRGWREYHRHAFRLLRDPPAADVVCTTQRARLAHLFRSSRRAGSAHSTFLRVSLHISAGKAGDRSLWGPAARPAKIKRVAGKNMPGHSPLNHSPCCP